MAGRADDVEAISRQRAVKWPHQCAGHDFACHEHIAENADALSGNHSLDRMQLLPKAKMVHVLQVRHIAPLSFRSGKPSLPGGCLEIGWRPIAMNEDVSTKAGRTLQTGAKFETADGPE